MKGEKQNEDAKGDIKMEDVSQKTQEAQNDVLSGEKTLNQIREQFGLEPVRDEVSDKPITKG